MLDFCTSLVLAVHLWCVNVASAGPLVSAWLDWRGIRREDLATRAARFLSAKALVLLFVGTVLGLIMAGLIWNDEYHQLLHAFVYKIKWAGWELLFSAVLMGLHSFLLWRGPAMGLVSRLFRSGIAVLAATNLLYHFPTLLLVVSEMNAGDLPQPQAVDAGSFRRLMAEPSVVARSAHFLLASFAVTGVALVAYGARLKRDETTEGDGGRVATWGARLALVPTLMQIVVGIWVISVLPAPMQQRLLGGDLVAAGLFASSIVVALYLMQQLAIVAMGDTSPVQLKRSVWLMVAVVSLMTITARRGASHIDHAREASPTSSTVLESGDAN